MLNILITEPHKTKANCLSRIAFGNRLNSNIEMIYLYQKARIESFTRADRERSACRTENARDYVADTCRRMCDGRSC